MIATYIPTTAPSGAKTPLEPELLAATLAKYSRSNSGITTLIKESEGKSPDAIFKFVDYGHASIAGLTGGIAIAIDEISMILAAKLFEFAQMADGQESSTRYIALSQNPKNSLVAPELLGIPMTILPLWETTTTTALGLYTEAMNRLEEEVTNDPARARIPQKALEKPKVAARMLKNYALDRARYLLPASCKTNIAIVASARTWADIIKLTASLPWPEATQAAHALRTELAIASPNLPRHSHPDEASLASTLLTLQAGQFIAASTNVETLTKDKNCQCRVQTFNPTPSYQHLPEEASLQFQGKTNRYSHPSANIKRITVQTEWDAVTFAEFRDLNRHRTGHRWSTYAPQGLHIPEETRRVLKEAGESKTLEALKKDYAQTIKTIARTGAPGLHCYAFLLGTQIPFEHTQQADKFLYEVELRTGLGAHPKYAEHLRQAADAYFLLHPTHKDFVTLGDAEPE
jgi:thymidylate synthase ThyX